jgi:hypothetical protein
VPTCGGQALIARGISRKPTAIASFNPAIEFID